MPVFHTRVIESILEPVAQQVSEKMECNLFINFISLLFDKFFKLIFVDFCYFSLFSYSLVFLNV
jgi:hypothetical protein